MRKNPKPKKKAVRKTALQRHMAKIASEGGKATLKKYGKDHFKKLVSKRWDKVKK